MAMKNYVAFLLYLCFCFGFPIKGYAQDYGMKYSCYYDGYLGGHGMIVSIIIAYMAIMVDSIFIILVGILRIICFDFR